MAERADKPREPASRLDVPLTSRRKALPRVDAETFGNFAEKVAKLMGTGGFLLGMTIFVTAWITLNVWGITQAWDPYPFIFLNLAFSTQASYAAPLILLAQNRQEDRDRMSVEEDRRVAAQSRADMDFLAREIAGLRHSIGELATRDYVRGELRAELREIATELDHLDEPGSADEPDPRPRTGSQRPRA